MADAGATALVGTYTDGPAEGIYALEIGADGSFVPPDLLAAVPDPSYLTLGPTGDYCYAVNEDEAGRVTAFEIERDPLGLSEIDRIATGGGADPCHLSVDPAGEVLLVAHYTGGAVAAVPLGADGRFGGDPTVLAHEGSGPDPERQNRPHPHAAVVGPDGRYCYVPDLGTDTIRCYDLAGAPALEHAPAGDVSMPAGSGPRQVVFHPFGEYAYAVNELDSTVGVLELADGPGLDLVQTVSSLPADYAGESLAAAGEIHDSGRWAYVSNRGHDSITRFEVTPGNGKLRSTSPHPSGGGWPRDFAISPDGDFLLTANKDTHEVVSFGLGEADGSLAETVGVAGVPAPVCLQFLEDAN